MEEACPIACDCSINNVRRDKLGIDLRWEWKIKGEIGTFAHRIHKLELLESRFPEHIISMVISKAKTKIREHLHA